MKKWSSIALLSAMLILSGCNADKVSNANESNRSGTQFIDKGLVSSGTTYYDVLEDKETGCMYLQGERSLTPYYDETGDVKGCKSAE